VTGAVDERLMMVVVVVMVVVIVLMVVMVTTGKSDSLNGFGRKSDAHFVRLQCIHSESANVRTTSGCVHPWKGGFNGARSGTETAV